MSGKRGLSVFLIAAAFAGGAILVATASGAQGDEVTLRLERYYDNACRCYKLRFSGAISSGAANEYVAVLQQKCGSGSSTAIAGASTRAGGVWEAEPVFGAHPEADSSTYRARWNGRFSEPLEFRGKIQIWLTKLDSRRQRVSINPGDTQNMKGRIVELQRLSAGQWTRVRQARLVGNRGTFSAVFSVRAPGLTLRVLVPAQSAAPCYAVTASKTWVSGRGAATAGGSSAKVIDRTLLCSTAMRGGVRLIEISASEGIRAGAGARAAFLDVSTNWSPDAGLVSASTGGLRLNPTRCTQTRTRVPLTAGNLEGGSPGSSGQEYECETPRRVLIRVRAAFRSPTALASSRDTFLGHPLLEASGEVVQASLAVRTQAGRLLAFASVFASGKARLYAAPSCREDNS